MKKNNLKQTIIEVLYWNPQVSMEEIAQKAMISKATIHRHFNGREGMMKDLFDFSLMQLQENLDKCGCDVDKILKTIIELGAYVSFLHLYPYDDDTKNQERVIRETLKQYYACIETTMVRPSNQDSVIKMYVMHSSVMTLWGQVSLGNLLQKDAVKIMKELYFEL